MPTQEPATALAHPAAVQAPPDGSCEQPASSGTHTHGGGVELLLPINEEDGGANEDEDPPSDPEEDTTGPLLDAADEESTPLADVPVTLLELLTAAVDDGTTALEDGGLALEDVPAALLESWDRDEGVRLEDVVDLDDEEDWDALLPLLLLLLDVPTTPPEEDVTPPGATHRC